MILNNNFLLFYKNNILEKKIKCNKVYNKDIKHSYLTNFKCFYDIFCVDNNINILNIKKIKNVHKSYIGSSCDVDDISLEESLLEIDKIFEGRNVDLFFNASLYKEVSILKKLFSSESSNSKMYFVSFSNNIFFKYFVHSYIFIYKKSLIVCPLTLDSTSFDVYIYSIYCYINNRLNNLYISSFISLFYYFNGLLISLLSMYEDNTIDILYSNIIFIVTRLSLFVILSNSIDNFFKIGTILSFKIINIINNIMNLFNLNYYIYKPYLIGITNYTLYDTGILSKLGFQNILKTVKGLILEDKIDWKIDSKSNIILSDFIPVNSGWYRYFINFK